MSDEHTKVTVENVLKVVLALQSSLLSQLVKSGVLSRENVLSILEDTAGMLKDDPGDNSSVSMAFMEIVSRFDRNLRRADGEAPDLQVVPSPDSDEGD